MWHTYVTGDVLHRVTISLGFPGLVLFLSLYLGDVRVVFKNQRFVRVSLPVDTGQYLQTMSTYLLQSQRTKERNKLSVDSPIDSCCIILCTCQADTSTHTFVLSQSYSRQLFFKYTWAQPQALQESSVNVFRGRRVAETD